MIVNINNYSYFFKMKEIKDYPDYYVTKDGKIYSKKFHKSHNPNSELREMKQIKNGRTGYLQIRLSENGKKKTFLVNRLVALTYIPNPNNLPEVDHRDCVKTNNHVSNLEWVTSSENKKRAYKNGLKKPLITNGEKNGNSKLTNIDVIWIRKNYIPNNNQFGAIALSKKYNVNKSVIYNIIKNKTWKHI